MGRRPGCLNAQVSHKEIPRIKRRARVVTALRPFARDGIFRMRLWSVARNLPEPPLRPAFLASKDVGSERRHGSDGERRFPLGFGPTGQERREDEPGERGHAEFYSHSLREPCEKGP